ncbi:MAG: hypothetical protein JW885_13070 [Deltaproteobacteria bacterium]|nr:hypothetical protein [Candidatus Zymogenaceae bacterium]
MLQRMAHRDNYDIEVDLAKNRIYFYPKGTWNKISDVPDYIDDLKACAKKLRPGFDIISDGTHFAAPTQEISGLILEGTTLMREMGQKRAAIIVTTSILKIILEKHKGEMEQEKMETRYFDNMTKAEEWLDER